MIRPALIVLLLSLVVSSRVSAQQASSSLFVLDRDKKQVVRHDAKGKVVWSVKFDKDIGGARPPHLLWDERRVYITHEIVGVTALDSENGKALWHVRGPESGMLLSDGLLLGTGPISNKDGTFSHWLFACEVAKGTVVFKTRLPKDMSDPQAVQEVAGLFLVQIGESPFGEGHALLIDRQGAVRHQFDHQVVCGKQSAGDIIFLTSKNVVRVTAKDKVAWAIPLDHEWIAGGGLIDLPDGDVIAFRFGRISDSGVSLIRFDPVSGKEKWRHNCGPLRVGHSAYSHTATVALEGEKLRVTSVGSYGTFVETLDLKTGRQLRRTRRFEPGVYRGRDQIRR
jgi:outer membrane protein assembly factor BamB